MWVMQNLIFIFFEDCFACYVMLYDVVYYVGGVAVVLHSNPISKKKATPFSRCPARALPFAPHVTADRT
jgi:hypothetical protein